MTFQVSSSALATGAASSTVLQGSTSGTLTLNAPAVADSSAITFPSGTIDFSATGGAHRFVAQSAAGAALTVAQPATADLSDIGTFNLSTSGTLATTNATASTSTTTGALTVTGGVGVQGKGSFGSLLSSSTIGFDLVNGMQNSGGDRLQIFSYWGLELRGHTQAGASPALVSGSAADPGIAAINTLPGAIALAIIGAPSQTADLQEWQNSAGVSLAAVDNNGNGRFASLPGATTNNNAPAGAIGEYISATVALASAVALTSGAAANVTSISLTAGDWDVSGSVGFSEGATTTSSEQNAAINTVSAALPTFPGDGVALARVTASATGDGNIIPTGSARLSLAATTTVYLVAQATFATSTCAAYGIIRARRMR